MITYEELRNTIAEKCCDYYNEPNLTPEDYEMDANTMLDVILQDGECVPGIESATRFFIPSALGAIFGAVGSIISFDEIDENGDVTVIGYELD